MSRVFHTSSAALIFMGQSTFYSAEYELEIHMRRTDWWLLQ